MKTIPYNELTFDKRFYPRQTVDSTHVQHIAEAIEAGADIPPIVVAQHEKVLVVVDGYHRANAYRLLAGLTAAVPATLKDYKNEAEMLLDSIRLNAGHGRNLCPADRAHCIAIARAFEIDDESIATAMNMTVERVAGFRQTKIASIKGTRRKLIVKTMIVPHMRGETFTEAQEEAMKHLPGNRQIFVVNTLIRLIESDLLNTEDEKLMARLAVLRDLLKRI